ncbi:MAG TPA: tetratricopeptide repeat protein [Casimicrobiaceae bacterium]|nr:tetratricopeptide repeat protein [Casimicrobiaceae bacterium]
MSIAIELTLENFEQVVRLGSTGVPVLVDFWAPWCAPCRALGPVLDKVARELAGRFTLAKLNTDAHPQIAQTYGVRGIPNCKLFVDGKVVDEFTGALPESAVREFLMRAIPSAAAPLVEEAKSRLIEDDARGALELLDQALAIDPDNEDAALTRMEALLAADRGSDATTIAEELESPQRARTRPVRDEIRLASLKARAQLHTGGAVDLDDLAKRVIDAPDDVQASLAYANALAARGDYGQALESLLGIVESDRSYGDDAARKTMLTIFEALGADSDIARRYRRELASALNR